MKRPKMNRSTKNAGRENDGPLIKITWHENAEYENAEYESAGHEKRKEEAIVYLLCIYRVLVRNDVFGVSLACFIGFCYFVHKGLMFCSV